MKKNILKRIFIKISKIFGYEVIDQNQFFSPTLNKELSQDLSTINEKSIVLPLGEVKITKKVESILIILRSNTEVGIWDQNKKRLFELPKIEYSLRCSKSLIKSINFSILTYQIMAAYFRFRIAKPIYRFALRLHSCIVNYY